MKIAISAVGSLGDVFPYIAIAKNLISRGHDVRIATSQGFRKEVIAAGATHYPLGHPSPQKVWQDIAKERPTRNIWSFVKNLYRQAGGSKDGLMQILEFCRDADIVVATTGTSSAIHAASYYGVPSILCHLSPLNPTSEFPRPIGPAWVHRYPWGKIWNQFTFFATSQMFWLANQQVYNEWLKTNLKMKPLAKWYPSHLNVPKLFGFSPSVLRKPADWTKTDHITGYWFTDQDDRFSIPEDLIHFLNTKDPVIGIAFGSQVVNSQFRDKVIIEGILKTGAKVVISKGWNIENCKKNNRIYEIDFIPYAWLFPRLTMVIHHCGAGTIAETIRAGVPSLPLPFTGEQRFWAYRIHSIGLGTMPLIPPRISANQVSLRICSTLNNQEMIAKSKAVGFTVRSENGVDNAAALIEFYSKRI